MLIFFRIFSLHRIFFWNRNFFWKWSKFDNFKRWFQNGVSSFSEGGCSFFRIFSLERIFSWNRKFDLEFLSESILKSYKELFKWLFLLKWFFDGKYVKSRKQRENHNSKKCIKISMKSLSDEFHNLYSSIQTMWY